MSTKIVDHLFRHQYGKMIAILSRIFGLHHLELIEDAVQDTFEKASMQWRMGLPRNPEAWLLKASKNRVIDLLRKEKAEFRRREYVNNSSDTTSIGEHFLDHEVEDSQLRMIFIACHPALSREEQIAFSLKTISGFSMKEIAAALLIREETIKKRLSRARKALQKNRLKLVYPGEHQIRERLAGVMQVIYLVFNEGFHSSSPGALISKELCGEALRLCRLLLVKERFRSGSMYALFSLMCFHAARLEARLNMAEEILSLEEQDRTQWYPPLIELGKDALLKADQYGDWSAYHIEAAIACEHAKASSFKETNWERILDLYRSLYRLEARDAALLNMAVACLQLNRLEDARSYLDSLQAKGLSQRQYLVHACYAEYYRIRGEATLARKELERAIQLCRNTLEKDYFQRKLDSLS